MKLNLNLPEEFGGGELQIYAAAAEWQASVAMRLVSQLMALTPRWARGKLEAFDQMRYLLQTACKVFPHFPDCRSLRQAANVDKPPACDCWHYRARAALAAAKAQGEA